MIRFLIATALLTVFLLACGGTKTCKNCTTGCCDGNGVCQSGNLATACGANGVSCTECAGGQSCSLGTCHNPGVGGGGGGGGGVGGGGAQCSGNGVCSGT